MSYYDSKNTLGISQEDYQKFWEEYLEFYAIHIPVRPFASQVLQHLKENGVQIYIITSRSWTTENSDRGEKMINLVKSWLARYHIPYDALYFTREKVTLCEKLKIDCMIDDKPQNIEMISKKNSCHLLS